jgi:hypothetical protein
MKETIEKLLREPGGVNFVKQDYMVLVELKAKYEINTIIDILAQGAALGFVYYDYILAMSNEEAPILNVEQAAEKVLTGQPREKNFNSIYIKYEDTNFIMFFYPKEDLLEVMICAFGYAWEKSFIHSYYNVDLARYTRLLLKVVNDFKIVRLQIEGEY